MLALCSRMSCLFLSFSRGFGGSIPESSIPSILSLVLSNNRTDTKMDLSLFSVLPIYFIKEWRDCLRKRFHVQVLDHTLGIASGCSLILNVQT